MTIPIRAQMEAFDSAGLSEDRYSAVHGRSSEWTASDEVLGQWQVVRPVVRERREPTFFAYRAGSFIDLVWQVATPGLTRYMLQVARDPDFSDWKAVSYTGLMLWVLAKTTQNRIPDPQVLPMQDGVLGLSWGYGPLQLSADVGPENTVEWFWRDKAAGAYDAGTCRAQDIETTSFFVQFAEALQHR